MQDSQQGRWWMQFEQKETVKGGVQAILRERLGRENAITSKELAKRVHAHERQVRAVIAELIAEGMPIGASSDGWKGGYYVIATAEELEAARAILKARATEILQRDRALCRAYAQHTGQAVQPMLLPLEA